MRTGAHQMNGQIIFARLGGGKVPLVHTSAQIAYQPHYKGLQPLRHTSICLLRLRSAKKPNTHVRAESYYNSTRVRK
jgi:hypothetical protein